MSRSTRFLVGIVFATGLALSLAVGELPAQSIYGTLTGIVSDPTGAVLPKASLKLRDENSGSMRDTVVNSDGYYAFVSLPPGTYLLTVEAAGFETFKQSG